MVEVLQRFSATNLTGLLGVVLLFWAVWPVLCGVLGARRGQGLQGVMHGLLWGPLALPVVLLGGSRHVCPTCGKRTLRHPAEPQPEMTLVMAPPVIARPASIEMLPSADHEPAEDPIAPANDVEEAAELHAWVNGDSGDPCATTSHC
ncbi:MAG: hypothetical protein ABII12_04380 [Planctomycetota bacterium]